MALKRFRIIDPSNPSHRPVILSFGVSMLSVWTTCSGNDRVAGDLSSDVIEMEAPLSLWEDEPCNNNNDNNKNK